QSRPWASFRAKVHLPTPSGPTNNSACGNRPCRRLCRNAATIRSWPRTECQDTLHLALDSLEDRFGVRGSIDQDDRGGIERRQRRRAAQAEYCIAITLADALLKGRGAVLDPVSRRADSRTGDFGRDIQDQGQIWEHAAGRRLADLGNLLQRKPA